MDMSIPETFAKEIFDIRHCLCVFGCGLNAAGTAEELCKRQLAAFASALVILVVSGLDAAEASEVAPAVRSEMYSKGGVVRLSSRVLLTDLLTKRLVAEQVNLLVMLEVERAGDLEFFCVRKFRETNRSARFVAMSERPARIASHVEDLMKSMFLDKVKLYPRHHPVIKQIMPYISDGLQYVKLTKQTADIQTSVFMLVDACLKEMNKVKMIAGDIQDWQPADLLIGAKELSLKRSSYWSSLPFSIRQIIRDIGPLRDLLTLLNRVDACSFYRHIRDLLAQPSKSPWMQTDHAQAIKRTAKKRLMIDGKVEVNPKIVFISDLLGIKAKRVRTDDAEPKERKRWLILAADERQKKDVQVAIDFGIEYAALEELNRLCKQSSELSDLAAQAEQALADTPITALDTDCDVRITCDIGKVREDAKAFGATDVVVIEGNLLSLRMIEWCIADHPLRVTVLSLEGAPEDDRRRQEVYDENGAFAKLIDIDQRLMFTLESLYFDLDIPPETAVPSRASSRKGSQMTAAISQLQQTVIVDLRELRSSLPFFLHKRKLAIRPTTLVVGDYILSRDICVERKSIPDLVQSLASGRLYKQAASMSKSYPCPALLIELDRDFVSLLSMESFHSIEINPTAVISQLVALSISFPSMRLLWSSSPQFTADMFASLKRGRHQPNLEAALDKEVDAESVSRELLKKCPGISAHNVNKAIGKFKSLKEMFNATEAEICEAVKNATEGKALFRFLNEN